MILSSARRSLIFSKDTQSLFIRSPTELTNTKTFFWVSPSTLAGVLFSTRGHPWEPWHSMLFVSLQGPHITEAMALHLHGYIAHHGYGPCFHGRFPCHRYALPHNWRKSRNAFRVPLMSLHFMSGNHLSLSSWNSALRHSWTFFPSPLISCLNGVGNESQVARFSVTAVTFRVSGHFSHPEGDPDRSPFLPEAQRSRYFHFSETGLWAEGWPVRGPALKA